MFFNEKKLRKQLKVKTTGYIMAAFGLVAALAWNDAIRSLIDYFFPLDKNGLWIKFIYAIIITLVIVIVGIILVRFEENKKDK